MTTRFREITVGEARKDPKYADQVKGLEDWPAGAKVNVPVVPRADLPEPTAEPAEPTAEPEE